jgi:hypothetical protein
MVDSGTNDTLDDTADVLSLVTHTLHVSQAHREESMLYRLLVLLEPKSFFLPTKVATFWLEFSLWF